MKTILFIHQSAELYGSDKTLFFLVKALPKHEINPIVVLPEEGPLTTLLREANIEVIISPIIKLSRSIFKPLNLVKLPFQIFLSLKKLNNKLIYRKIDLVHSNTLAVLLGAFYSKWKKIDHIWHVHEIIERPRLVNMLYRSLVNFLSSNVVFNSKASLLSLVSNNKKLGIKSKIIYNGIEMPDKSYSFEEINNFRVNELKLPSDALVIGIVGRISRWKGQQLLLEAFEKLQKENERLYLLIIGSPPSGQDHYLSNLSAEILTKGLGHKVHIYPFTQEIWKYWLSIDIAVVPSTEPEPFGMVAIEAMLVGKPVVAAGHGGLLEIIEHKRTGLLFDPNNVDDLFASLKLLMDDEVLRNSLGANGKKSVLEQFTINNYIQNFVDIYQNATKDG